MNYFYHKISSLTLVLSITIILDWLNNTFSIFRNSQLESALAVCRKLRCIPSASWGCRRDCFKLRLSNILSHSNAGIHSFIYFIYLLFFFWSWCLGERAGGYWDLRCCGVANYFRRWSQTLRCAVFLIFNLQTRQNQTTCGPFASVDVYCLTVVTKTRNSRTVRLELKTPFILYVFNGQFNL